MKELSNEIHIKIRPDGFWVEKEFSKFDVNIRSKNNKKIITKGDPEGGTDSKLLSALDAFKRSKNIYQLGVKTFILIDEKELEKKNMSTESYNRYYHSLGVRTVGMIWWKALEDEIYKTIYRDSYLDIWRKCLEIALLLHDTTHLPFSHLAEEVFNELGISILGTEKHAHDEGTLDQLSNEDKKKLKEIIKEIIGNETEGDYYNFIKNIMAGVSGIPFIDAIANSPIDADKIDYIFRDSKLTETGTRLPQNKKEWLETFLSNMRLTKEGLIYLEPDAAECALDLLKERMHLYNTLYFSPASRAIEKMASLIAVTYLQYFILEENWKNGGISLHEFLGKICRDKLIELQNSVDDEKKR